MNTSTFVCMSGHVEPAISMSAFEGCKAPQLKDGRPCTCAQSVVKLPHDPGLLEAFEAGGTRAVLVLLRHRALELSRG